MTDLGAMCDRLYRELRAGLLETMYACPYDSLLLHQRGSLLWECQDGHVISAYMLGCHVAGVEPRSCLE